MAKYKVGQTVLTTCNINSVKAGAKVKIVEYREENWDKAKALTGKSSKVALGSSGTRRKPEHWVAKFVEGETRKGGDLPTKTFILYEHMIQGGSEVN